MSLQYEICPKCREQIKKGATVCPHCKRDIAPLPDPHNESKASEKKKMWE